MNLGHYASYWAKHLDDQPAAVFKEKILSWSALTAQSDAIAAVLQDMGVEKGDRVGCMLHNSLEWVISYAAIFKAGAILVPLNPRYSERELQEIGAQVKCSVVVTQPALINKLAPGTAQALAPSEAIALYPASGTPLAFDAALASGGKPVDPKVAPDDLAVIAFTSGSTGLPKGAMLSHHSIDAYAIGLTLGLGLTSNDRFLLLAPFAFTGGVISSFTPSYVVGGCVFIEEAFEPTCALAAITRDRITIMNGVPILWQRMSEVPGFADADITCVRGAITGGAPVSQALLKRYADKGVCIRQTFGVTENSGMIAMPNEKFALEKPWACGWPLPTVELRVVNNENCDCAANEPGEILIRGEQIFKGYWENPTATQAAWFDGWYRTGDIGSLDDMGHLQVLDRKKSMIISGGVNIYPAEIERAIGAIDGITDVIAFGLPDDSWGERLIAIVHGATQRDAASLLAECRTVLGGYKTPKELIVSRQPLPRTTTGKVLRSDIQKLYDSMHDQPRALAKDAKERAAA